MPIALALIPAAQAHAQSGTPATAATTDATGDVATARLPDVLSASDDRLYREVFALQEAGDWRAADRAIGKLQDRRLMGHVLAQRYLHPTAYRSKYIELRDWLAEYADHPQAERIYKLALKRRPKNYKYPQSPIVDRGPSLSGAVSGQRYSYRSPKKRSKAMRQKVRRLMAQINRNVLRTRLTKTEELLDSPSVRKLLDAVELDQGRARVAAGWFYYGKPDKAFALADPAARQSGEHLPLAHWTAGISAWRLGRLDDATWHFEQLANSTRVSTWNSTAGAYWAARAHLRQQRPAEMSRWLSIAAAHPRTFYGLLARRALGMTIDFDFGSYRLDDSLLQRLEAHPRTRRALALLQTGRRDLAERELVRFGGWAEPGMSEGLIALAERGGLPGLAFRMGRRLASSGGGDGGGAIDAALYPIPPWRPAGGFKVDRALVYALMRQESSFNPDARSPDGARGLMQLMPRTASYMSDGQRFRGKARAKLYDPALNLELGQRYIEYLLNHERVRGDLFRLTTAYNGGPGNLGKWQRHIGVDDDPLLFIESLPSRETRLFIERVLTNLWIYRQRLDQEAPSLDALAAGDWPWYQALDGRTPQNRGPKVAQHVEN